MADDVARALTAAGAASDPAAGMALLTALAPGLVEAISREAWDEGHEAGMDDGRDGERDSQYVSPASNPYVFARVQSLADAAYLATLTFGDDRDGLVLAGHGLARDVVDEAMRFHLFSSNDTTVVEEHRTRVLFAEPGALAEQSGDGWWAEVAFADVDETTAVTIASCPW